MRKNGGGQDWVLSLEDYPQGVPAGLLARSKKNERDAGSRKRKKNRQSGIISTLERLRQWGPEFKASSDCTKIHLKEIKNKRQRQ